MQFYSARLLHISLIEDGKESKRHLYEESVVVFRARNWDDAFARALELGKQREQTYENGNGHMLHWKFVEVVALDFIGKKVDGAEVASKFEYKRVKEPLPHDTEFHPEKSEPAESI